LYYFRLLLSIFTKKTMAKKFSLKKNKIKVLLLEGIHESAVKAFNEAGYTNVEYLKTALDGVVLGQKIKDVHIIGIRSRTQYSAPACRPSWKCCGWV